MNHSVTPKGWTTKVVYKTDHHIVFLSLDLSPYIFCFFCVLQKSRKREATRSGVHVVIYPSYRILQGGYLKKGLCPYCKSDVVACERRQGSRGDLLFVCGAQKDMSQGEYGILSK